MNILDRIKALVRDEVKNSTKAAAATPAAPQAAAAESPAPGAPAEGVITAEISGAIQAAVKESLTEINGRVTQLETDLATAKQTIKSLEGQVADRDTKITTLEKERNDLQAKIPGQVAAKAAETAAAQGVPAPLPVAPPNPNPAAAEAPKTELKGLAKAQAAIKAELERKK